MILKKYIKCFVKERKSKMEKKNLLKTKQENKLGTLAPSMNFEICLFYSVTSSWKVQHTKKKKKMENWLNEKEMSYCHNFVATFAG